MFKEVSTEKLYYGFPIFVLGYQDEQFDYNITTCSSSYSLGDTVVFGLFKGSNAAKQLLQYKECSINLLPKEEMALIELAGFNHASNKLLPESTSFSIYEKRKIPILDNSMISLIVHIKKTELEGNFIHFFGKIETRLVNEACLSENKLALEKINPPIFVGDGSQKIYRFFNETITSNGSYLGKSSRKK